MSYRLCGQQWDYMSEPDEENSREGWIMHRAVCAPRMTPNNGDRVTVGEDDYIVRHWTVTDPKEAPEACTEGRLPNQGVFDLVLEPA